MKRLLRHHCFKGHCVVGRRDRRAAGRKVKIASYRNNDHSNDQAENEFQVLSFLICTYARGTHIIILSVRGFLRLLWMALLLVTVALVSALVTMRLAVHGREVEVPDVHGKTPGEALRLAEGSGLSTQIERQYYSPTVPEGRVLSQVPDARDRLSGVDGIFVWL